MQSFISPLVTQLGVKRKLITMTLSSKDISVLRLRLMALSVVCNKPTLPLLAVKRKLITMTLSIKDISVHRQRLMVLSVVHNNVLIAVTLRAISSGVILEVKHKKIKLTADCFEIPNIFI